MKKTKTKVVTAPKGNLKISNFFKKIDNTNGDSSEQDRPLKNITNNSDSPKSKRRKIDNPEKNGDKEFHISTKTPEKILFQEENPIKTDIKPSTSVTEQQSQFDVTLKHISPDIDEDSPSKKTPKKSPTTPSKERKSTPRKKLFEKSPKHLEKFNVEILTNFMNITPSKTNTIEKTTPIKSGKKQGSILKYISPSPKSKTNIQETNEKTPTRLSKHSQNHKSPSPKAKIKLDFSQIKTSPENVIGDLNGAFEDSWGSPFKNDLEFSLNLEQAQHCQITNIDKHPRKVILQVKSTINGEKAICKLEGFWMNLNLNSGDCVHLSAVSTGNEWVINNEQGLLVYEPDLLISSTSIVNTIFCKRRTVLCENFIGHEPANKQMLVGICVHTLLQTVLRDKVKNPKKIHELLDNLLKSNSLIKKLYDSSLSIEEISKEIEPFIPRILDFVNQYVLGKTRGKMKDNWKGTIQDIDDIEENIWSPELGIKGKIDVTIKSENKIMPLELKTGRATGSLEHRGQVILYLMMMHKLGYNVSSGLLLYLREGVLKEIPITHKEERDIIILRNDLAFYLKKSPEIMQENGVRKVRLQKLPDPINHHSACAKCPYNIICTTYLKHDNYDLTNYKHLKEVQSDVTAHLNEKYVNYFIHWSTLLFIESKVKIGLKNLHEIYTVKPEERESNGRCLINLKITNLEIVNEETFLHTFEKNGGNHYNFFSSGLQEGHYVVVSVSKRPAVASGFVTSIDSRSITVNLDRNLNKKYLGELFYLDTYDSVSLHLFNLSNLALLLENTEQADRLRKIIIDKQPTTYKEKLSSIVATKAKPILKKLNRVQQRAILKALTTNDYLLIKGMPGTGKTATIVCLVQLLVELNKTVLITSQTHAAVDNVCLRLHELGIDFLRLGTESKIHEKLREKSEHYLIRNCKSPGELEKVYGNAKVLAVTCLGSGHPVLTKRTLDFCIVDESTQVVQSSILRCLYASKTFILIGDPEQLPPIIKSKEALDAGMSETLFDRLNTSDSTVTLNLNYRMNKYLTEAANVLTYNGDLLIGNEEVANSHLTLVNEGECRKVYGNVDWVMDILSTRLEDSLKIVDTGPIWGLEHQVEWALSNPGFAFEQNYMNIYEAAVATILVNALIKGGVSPKEIGVIAVYRAQVAQISALLKDVQVDISTVDQFQGQDKSVIIYSCTKSRDINIPKIISKYEILEDQRRLTVAITRAKVKLILLADVQTIKEYTIYTKLFNSLIKNNYVILNNYPDFQWDNILNLENFFDLL